MLTLLRKLPWFEWVAIITVSVSVMMVVSLVKKYGQLESDNTQLTTKNESLQTELTEERHVAKVTDEVILQYNFDRELKIQDALGYQATTLEEYFATRDNYKPPTIVEQEEKENGDVDVKVDRPRPTPVPKPKVVVDTAPNPAAIAVLAAGMHRTYCRAYSNGDSCTPVNSAH